ncbi:MAG TPA: GNAT family N-acetyltransferase [Thermoleophilaceae bacterium]|nr:GNAT family N-acetyltransferase [Thermoleophilaceae bacterium]
MLASVERLLGDPDTDFLLVGEPAAGVCQLRYRHSVWTGTDDCWLEDLFIEDAARGEGLGAALVDAAIARAAERGAARIGLDVADANATARALYESRGFERDAHLMKRLV